MLMLAAQKDSTRMNSHFKIWCYLRVWNKIQAITIIFFLQPPSNRYLIALLHLINQISIAALATLLHPTWTTQVFTITSLIPKLNLKRILATFSIVHLKTTPTTTTKYPNLSHTLPNPSLTLLMSYILNQELPKNFLVIALQATATGSQDAKKIDHFHRVPWQATAMVATHKAVIRE